MGKKLLEDNNVLNEFAASHQSGRIVLAVADHSTVLYLACRTGLYRYVWDGSVIEQIADGQMVALGDSQYDPYALQILDNEQFRVYFSGNYMVEMYYDEALPARPSKELTVYSLEENGRIRYAGRLFQKEHPDVLVKYETGIDGDNAVSREDALKNLNTKILAGEVPDVIILDNIDMEQYADKGVLKELDDFLAPYEEEGILYRNILEGMIAGAELAREEHPDGPLIDTPCQENLFNIIIPICLPAWTGEDGSLDTDSLTKFYESAVRLWELDSEGFSEEGRLKWQQALAEETDLANIMFGQYEDFYGIGETWINLGYLKNAWYGVTNLHTRMENYRNDYSYYKKLDDEVVYGRMTGQAGNIYRARTITGLCEQAAEPELAEELQWLFDRMEESDCCYRTGTLLEETVREVGFRVLEGELTPGEGAKEVERKMAISMNE